MTSDRLQSTGLSQFTIPGSNYGYNGTPIEEITSFENTLAATLFDESGSTRSFARQMELTSKEIVKFLRRSPRKDNLMYSHNHFDHRWSPFHGWKKLMDCNPDDYDGCWAGGGQTHLYDSEDRLFQMTLDYGREQAKKKYTVNAIAVVMTDGVDFTSTLGQNDVKKTLTEIAEGEELESFMTILIGINDRQDIQDQLKAHADFCGFTQYVPVGEATDTNLAKIAKFVSQSIQAQSVNINKGLSQSLTF